MSARIGSPRSIVALLYVCFLVLSGPILLSQPAYRAWLRGWVRYSCLGLLDPAGISLSHESADTQEIMNRESTELSIRAFRAVSRQRGLYHKWLIIEDTASSLFRCVGYSASPHPPTKDIKATIDRDDAWNVLNFLRDAARMAERASFPPLRADSIDDAIAQQQTEWQELQNLKSQPMSSKSAPKGEELARTGKTAKPMIRVTRGPAPSEEELQRMIDEVWEFAASLHLEWRAGRRTAAGHECEILTFDGLEKVLVHRTSVEIPRQSK